MNDLRLITENLGNGLWATELREVSTEPVKRSPEWARRAIELNTAHLLREERLKKNRLQWNEDVELLFRHPKWTVDIQSDSHGTVVIIERRIRERKIKCRREVPHLFPRKTSPAEIRQSLIRLLCDMRQEAAKKIKAGDWDS